MTRALTRTNFHSSKLIRTLANLEVLETTDSTVAYGERLGQWIDFADAIALTGVHKAGPASAPTVQRQASPATDVSLGDAFSKARIAMESTIAKSGAPDAGKLRAELNWPKLDAPLDDGKVYTPLRRFHQAHQRDMESKVRSLRATLRDGIAIASPKLQQLAELDAAFDGILGEREAKLLATVPSLLEKRFNQLRRAHLQTAQVAQQTDDNPDAWMRPGGWLARFRGELQAVLLAELDLRLQPAVGLLEALKFEKTEHV